MTDKNMSKKEEPIELQQQGSRTSHEENKDGDKNVKEKTKNIADYGGSATESDK